ncbi:Cap binding protein [Neofusicoccum parvum]|uniref:Cap binding protein n=1 Tax=Neofusicoccum parvum TaxID=310453 RepID=A0ACB5S8M1_9PEZI|nr:Cap binding protein [Neofusicoccum parvum]
MASAMEGIAYQDASTYRQDIREVASDFRQRALEDGEIEVDGEGGASPKRMELASHLELKMVLDGTAAGAGGDANKTNTGEPRQIRIPVAPRKLLEARSRRGRRDNSWKAAPSRSNYYSVYCDWDKAGDFYRPAPRSRTHARWAHVSEHDLDDDNMADVSPRPSGRFYDRGNKRKRRHNDDDYDDRRDERRPTRQRRTEEPTVAKLRKQLLSIAESLARDSEDDARDIARLASDNYEDEEFRLSFLHLSVQLSVTEQPFKIPFTAAVILYLNDAKPEFVKEVLDAVQKIAQEKLEAGDWRVFKLLLRFLACLQGLFEGEGVFSVLDELFSRAVDLQAASSEDTVGLELVKIILLTIPYVISSGAPGVQQAATDILEKTEIVASASHVLEAMVEQYPGVGGSNDDKPFGYQSVIGLLQKQLQNEAAKDWKLSFLPKVHNPVKRENGSEETKEPVKYAFPAINIPSPVNGGPRPLFPESYFSLFADQDVETVPKTSDIAASLLRDSLVDTINILDYSRNAVAGFLINIDCYWAPDTFVKRGTPFDRLKETDEQTTWKPEDIIVDAVFSQIFTLPAPEHKLVYYHSLITEACKLAPGAIAPSLGRAIRFLFRHVDVMDMELSYRFMDWFAHHLSNFDFRWKWSEWSDEVNMPDIHPRKAFIIGALDKEIRLSFAKRIRETLPPDWPNLITEAKEKDTPDFKYESDQTPYAPQGRELLSLLKKKASEDEIQKVINSIHEQAAEHDVADVLTPSTDAYVTCICYIGSKSLSHVLSCIERCKERLLAIGPASETARKQIITSVTEYWKDQPGIAVNIVDKLLNYTILSPMCVVQWALSDRLGAGGALSESWIFEMVAGTVGKVTNRVRQIVAARLQKGLPEEQVQLLDDTLTKERDAMRQLFQVIDDVTSGVAQGAADGFIEADGSEGMDEEKGKLIKAWGERWSRVFRRKAAVEEAIVGESIVEVKVAALNAAVEAEKAAAEQAAAEAEAAAAETAAAEAAAAEEGANGTADLMTVE